MRIPKETGKEIQFNDEFANKDNDVKQMVFNLIINQAFRQLDLKQIGKSPRFFDPTRVIDLSRSSLMIMPGFKASAFQTELGCTMAIDSIFKFMCTTTCLQKMNELKARAGSESRY